MGAVAALLACLLLPLALAAVWLDRTIDDGDRFVDTVAPAVEDEGLQEAVAERLAVLVADQLPRVLDSRPTVRRSAEMSRQAALRVVRSDAFPPIFRKALRAAHDEALRVLRDERTDGTVTIELTGLVDVLAEELDPSGRLARRVGDREPSVTVPAPSELEQARSGYDLLDRVSLLAPLCFVVLVVIAALLARRRATVALGFGAGCALILAIITLGVIPLSREVVVDLVPSSDTDLLEPVVDLVFASLRSWMLTGLGLAAAAGLLAGVLLRLGERRRPAETGPGPGLSRRAR